MMTTRASQATTEREHYRAETPAGRLCLATIDLRRPIYRERVRAGFQPHWRTVFGYRCPDCGGEHRMFASSFRGRTAEPSVGGIRCGRVLATA
jgi:hypothetical protein